MITRTATNSFPAVIKSNIQVVSLTILSILALCAIFLGAGNLNPLIGRTPTAAASPAPWPAQRIEKAILLTGLDDDLRTDLSGAHWNSLTRTLWVAKSKQILALVEDGLGSFRVADGGKWQLANDLEGITQADLNQAVVYVLTERKSGEIKAITTATQGQAQELQTWVPSAHLPPAEGRLGPEGLTFVPDFWLAENGFVDAKGKPYTSQFGMGGLMFVAHQNGGDLYVFDLDPNSANYHFVGQYATARSESSGLEFDRSVGRLYISHEIGANFLEVSDLASIPTADGGRRLRTLLEFTAPNDANLEGFAVTPWGSGDHWCFYTEDYNNQRDPGAMRSLQWYQNCSVMPM